MATPNQSRPPSAARSLRAVQPEDERLSRRCLPDRVRVRRQLVADRGSNQVGSVGIEALADQQVDLPEIDVAHVDRDLLRIGPRSRVSVHFHLFSIHVDGVWNILWRPNHRNTIAASEIIRRFQSDIQQGET